MFTHDPDALGVELGRHHAGFEPGPLEGAQDVMEPAHRRPHRCLEPDDPGLVLGVAGIELLTIGVGCLRVRGHDETGDRSVHTGTPAAFATLHMTVPVIGGSPLTEVPDVAALSAAYQSVVASARLPSARRSTSRRARVLTPW